MAKKTNLNEQGGERPEAEGEQPTDPMPFIGVAAPVVETPTVAEMYPPCPRCKNTAGKPVGKPFEDIFRGTEKIVTQYIKCTKCGQTYFTKTTSPLK